MPHKFKQLFPDRIKKLLIPEWNRRTIVKLVIMVTVLTVLFAFVLQPCFIYGESMMPTYGSRGLVFCNRLRYWRSQPQRGDIIVVKYFGNKYLLKRLLALEGDTVEFSDGVLIRNGQAVHEPYVRYRNRWNIKPFTVAPGHCFIVGDNRGQSPAEHLFGEVELSRIAGGLLF